MPLRYPFEYWANAGAGVVVEPPAVTNVQITGDPIIGETLTVTYDYTGGRPESGTTFQWYRADDDEGTNVEAITGATSATYVVDEADHTKFLSCTVTPSDGVKIGTPVAAEYDGPVLTELESVFLGRAGFWADLTPGSGNAFTTYDGTTEATQPGDMIGRIDSPYGADVVPEGDENYCLNMMVGSGGLPYGWAIDGSSSGLTRSLEVLPDTDGVPFLRVVFSGTTTSSVVRNILSSAYSGGIPTAKNESRNCKVTLRLSPGKSVSGLTASGALAARSSGGAFLSLIGGYFLTGLTETWEDYSISGNAPNNDAVVAATHTICLINCASDAVIDFGIDIKLPHIGKGLTPPARVQKNYWTLGGKLSFAQPTSAARPYLAVQPEGGVTNICDWSEDLTKAPSYAGVTATEDSITEATTSNTHEVRRGPLLPTTGMQLCTEVLVKMEGTRNLALRGWGIGGGNFVLFDLINGTVLQSGGTGWDTSKTTITDASAEVGEPGWWWCRAVATATTSTDNSLILNMVDGTNLSYTGDGTSTLRVKKTSINYGTEHKPYQLRKSANEVYQEGKRNCWYARGEGTQWMTLGVPGFGKASLFADTGQKFIAGGVFSSTYFGTLYPRILSKRTSTDPDSVFDLRLTSTGTTLQTIFRGSADTIPGDYKTGASHLALSDWDGVDYQTYVDANSPIASLVGSAPDLMETILLGARGPESAVGGQLQGRALPFLLDTTDKPLTSTELARIKELLAYQGGVTL